MQPARFCEQCGAPLKPTTRFCGQCGAPVQLLPTPPVAAPPPPPSPAPLPAQTPVAVKPEPEVEPVVGVISGLERSKGFGTEVFFLIVTPHRLVFAKITQAVMNNAIQQARADAKQRGEGMFAQVAAQMAWMDIVAERYATAPVDETLAEQPGNLVIPNAQIKQVVTKSIKSDRNELVIETPSGKHNYMLNGIESAERLKEGRELLRRVLGAVVR